MAYSSASKGVFCAHGKDIVFVSPTSRRVVLSRDDASVSEVKANGMGTLLAIASGSSVEIWIIDPHGSRPPHQYHKVDLESPVLALEWHPAAYLQAGLLILTQARITSVYCDGLSVFIERTKLVDEDSIPIDLASLSFGSTDSVFGYATLYLASRDGDFYEISPCLPSKIAILPEQEQDLKNICGEDAFAFAFNRWSEQDNTVVRVLARKGHDTQQPLVNQFNIARLSPLKLRPYPKELYEEDSIDLCAGNVNWGADVLVHTTTRFVNVFVASADELVLVHSLEFKPSKVRRIELFTSDFVVVNSGSDSTHLIHIDELLSALLEGDEKPHVKVDNVAPGIPFAVHRKLVLLNEGRPPREFPIAPKVPEESLSSLQISEVEPGLYANAPEPLATGLPVIQVTPNFTPGVHFEANAKTLFELGQLSQHFRTQIFSVHKLIVATLAERAARERDFASQSETRQFLNEKASACNQIEQQSASVGRTIERNKSLLARIEAIKARVEKYQNGNVASKAEEKWFESLSKDVPTKLARQNEALSQLQARLEELKTLPLESHSKFSTDQIIEIQQRLREQSRNIETVKADIHRTNQSV